MPLYFRPFAAAATLFAAAGIAVAVRPAHAQSLAFDITLGADAVGGGYGNFGYSFSVNLPITVTGLSFFNYNGNGIVQNHDVGLWNADGSQLLSSVTISPADGYALSTYRRSDSSPPARWYEHAVAPVVLLPGTYVLATATMAIDDFYSANRVSIAAQPGVSYGKRRYVNNTDGKLAFPSGVDNTVNGDFGPNFQFVAVPEARTPALLAGAAFAATLLARRRTGRRPLPALVRE